MRIILGAQTASRLQEAAELERKRSRFSTDGADIFREKEEKNSQDDDKFHESACSKSAIKSSASSKPMENRTMEPVIPLLSNSAAVKP